MTIEQVKDFFIGMEEVSCPLTEKLVKAGYQQVSGGYIDRAKREGILVDYKNNSPSQYWHLMTYCDSRDNKKPFNKNIVCGELIFWMAEVSGAVDIINLGRLANQIIESADNMRSSRPRYNRIKWNRVIQESCFEKLEFIINKVEAFKIALNLAVEKGWREKDMEYMWSDGEKFLFRLIHPSNGDFGTPVGIRVKDGIAKIVELI